MKTLLEHGDIEMGHARALLALDDQQQSDAGRVIAAKQLTVRETENSGAPFAGTSTLK